ncbi:MAG: serine/threonine-protein phosphatase, partial [Oscillospiraceae bacterium]
MNYIISASTDVGIKKETNQDSLTVKILETPQGKMTFAVLCDGMGGLSKGEVASASVIEAFSNWALHCLPLIFQTSEINEHIIFQQWNQIIQSQNQSIMNY